MLLSKRAHLTICKYIYSGVKHTLSARKNFKVSVFFNEPSVFKLIHALSITPNPINIYMFIAFVRYGRVFTQGSKNNLEQYVSFTRAGFIPSLKAWCDWCSINNGYLSFLINAINEYYECHEKNIPANRKLFDKLQFIVKQLKYLRVSIAKNASPLNRVELAPVDLFPRIYHGASLSLQQFLKSMTRAYNIIQEIEHYWCPFKHMQRIASLAHMDKHQHEQYLKCDNFDDIIKAGEIINKFSHIKCNECIAEINLHYEDRSLMHNEHQPVDEFFKLVCQLTR